MLQGPIAPSLLDFLLGNYVAVARTGPESALETHAARALLALPDAIPALQQFDSPDGRFYLGVAHWMCGDDEAAQSILRNVQLPHARNLYRLITQPKIRVLAQFSRELPLKDPRFEMQVIGYGSGQLPAGPYTNIHQYYDRRNPPDFYLASVVEGRDIPINIQELPAPIFGATSDYDLMIQSTQPWLRAFDEIVVAGPQEWNEVSQLTRQPVSTFPKIYGVAEELPPVPLSNRELDVFISGTIIHPFNPDKIELIHEVLRMPGLRTKVVNGFLDRDDYLRHLANARVCFTFVRRPTEMPTRGLEALSMAVPTLVQEGSALSLYAGEEHGVVTYRSAADLAVRIRGILEAWPCFYDRAQRGAHLVRSEFKGSRVFSQYMRYLTVLAARPRSRRVLLPQRDISQREAVFFRGGMPNPAQREVRRGENLARHFYFFDADPSPTRVTDAARDLVLEYGMQTYPVAERTRSQVIHTPSLLGDALKIYSFGRERFPKSLVIRFNLIRTMLHFGRPAQVLEGLLLAEEVLRMPEAHWEVTPFEDIFPWDFFSQMFNYRACFEAITHGLMEKKDITGPVVRLVYASLCTYLGWYSQDPALLRRAASLDPEQAWHRYSLACCLVRMGTVEALSEAGPLLEELVESSVLFIEAWQVLKALKQSGTWRSAALPALEEKMTRLEASLSESPPLEEWTDPFLKPCPPTWGLVRRAIFGATGGNR